MQRSFLVMLVLLAALTAVACGATPVAAPGDAATPAATATPAPAATATAGPVASATVAPTTAATIGASGVDADAVIVLKRTGGIAGRNDEWTISGDGRVVDGAGAETQVDAGAVAALVAQARAADFFAQDISLAKMSQCADCFHYVLSISAGGDENTVSFEDAQEGVPQSVWDLMLAVKALATAGQ